MARLACAVALLLAMLVAPASAADRDQTRAVLAGAMGAAGAASGALVVDLSAGEELYAAHADRRRVPASVQKLYTTAAALRRLGPDARLVTSVLASAPVGEDGTLVGDLYLRGAGDPTLGAAGISALVGRLKAEAGLERIEGRVVGDETAFDRRRGPPASSFRTSGYVGPLSALAYNRGLTGVRAPYFQVSPGLFAAQALDRELRAQGIRISGRAVTGDAPATAIEVAAMQSPTLADLVQRTNRPSDNYFAEQLLKVLGARLGARGSTAEGARVVRRTMGELGLSPSVSDGSGLGRGNRTSPRQVVGLLRAMAQDAGAGPAFTASLPVAGDSGTLTGRMRGTAAAGNCRAKTGTLRSVSALAGYCRAADGESWIAFAFLMNGVNPSGARALQDRMAAALARYEP
jgi:D-alanyl-D-alanine carboxypeptidase/D-alanyl-D-alanine-endopeptidase (penicillin-binding protein 4)